MPVLARVLMASSGLGFSWKPWMFPFVVHLDHPELRGVVDPAQGYGGQGALLLVELHQLPDVHVRQRVARDDDEGVVEPVRPGA